MMHRKRMDLDGGGVWWVEEGNLWGRNGQIALPNAETREEAQASLARFNAGEFFCAGCHEWHEGPSSGQRFAGLYCAEAWELYKKQNERRCRICRRPIYECYC
jgi:hypothetical protein